MNYTISKADKQQFGVVLDLMLDGISSDPSSVGEMGKSWWRRLFFRYVVGPRMLRNQMETFVAVRDERVVGYLIFQDEGDTASTFDWAVLESLDEEGLDILGDLIEAALDHTEQRGNIPLAYFGMPGKSDPRIRELLAEMGFWLADYQMGQFRAPLPLAESPQLPPGIALKPQISLRFGKRLPEFIRMDFDLPDPGVEEAESGNDSVDKTADGARDDTTDTPNESEESHPLSLAEQVDVICELHQATLRASKIYLVEEEGEVVGMVQQFAWKEEIRLLLALEPFLWGTETEQQLVAAMPGYAGKRDGYLRVRTFSSAHLNASRESLEALGLRYEEAPWQRWVVGL